MKYSSQLERNTVRCATNATLQSKNMMQTSLFWKKKKLNKSNISLGSSLFMVCLVYNHNVTPLLIKLSEEHRLAHRLTRKTYTTFLKKLPISINHRSVNEVTGHLQRIFTYSLLAACAVTHINIRIWRSLLIWLFYWVKSTKWCVRMQIKHKVLSEFPQRTTRNRQWKKWKYLHRYERVEERDCTVRAGSGI